MKANVTCTVTTTAGVQGADGAALAKDSTGAFSTVMDATLLERGKADFSSQER